MEKKLPKGWLETNISNLLVDDKLFTDGDWIESKDQDEDGDVRLIQLADIGLNEFKNKSNRKLYYNKAIELRCFFLEKNDVLIARLPDPLGRSCLFPLEGNYVTVVDVAVIRLNDSYYKPKLLSYFINSPEIQKRIMELSSGSTRLRISRKNLNTISIPFPPLAEQERIASKLDELFGRIEVIKASMEKIPQLLKDFRQQVLTSAVTGKLTEEWRESKELEEWKTLKAKECCDKVQSGGTPKGSKFSTEGIPFLKVYNIVNNKVDFYSKPQFVSEEIHNGQIKKSIAYPGDVIMNIVGPPLNKVAILPKDFLEWNLNQAITIFRTGKDLYNKYLYHFFCEGRSVKSLGYELRGVVGQANISLSQCRDFAIHVPPIKEQEEIVSRVESLFAKADKIEEQYVSLKEKIDVLPQLLLHKAFKGELVEQLPTDGDAADLLKEIMALKKDVKKKKK